MTIHQKIRRMKRVMGFTNKGRRGKHRLQPWSFTAFGFQQFSIILKRITYKENFWFTLASCPYTHMPLCVTTSKVMDSRRPDVEIFVSSTGFLTPKATRSPGHFIDEVLSDAKFLEVHECLENFRVDGELWKDPHEKPEKDNWYTVRGINPVPPSLGVKVK